MIGDKTYLRSVAQIVKQDFDFVYESDSTTVYGQVKRKSLEDYDCSCYDNENSWLDITLDRWGDRRLAHANH